MTLALATMSLLCEHASDIDQLFGEHATINQIVVPPIRVQSGRRFTDQSYAPMTIGSMQKRSSSFRGNLTMN